MTYVLFLSPTFDPVLLFNFEKISFKLQPVHFSFGISVEACIGLMKPAKNKFSTTSSFIGNYKKAYP